MKTHMGCFAVLIGVFYLVGFGLLGYGMWSAWRSTQAKFWPITPGTITQLAVVEHSDSESTSYAVKVQYTYSVNGIAYEGTRLAFGYVASSGRKTHDEIHTKLLEAKVVGVRYDPSDLSVACLSFGMHRSIQLILTFAVTGLAFVFGLTLLWWPSSCRDATLLNNSSVQ